MGVVAHPQGSLAHGILFPLGFERSLAVGLAGEGVELRAHLRMEGRAGQRAQRLGGSPRAPLPASLTSCPGLHLGEIIE